MKNEEKKIIRMLDFAVRDDAVRMSIDTIVSRVERKLENNSNPFMAWEPIPMELYNQPLPGTVKSSWIFVLRKNTITGAERHPNSIQRMMSYKGKGDIQTKFNSNWNPNFLISDFSCKLENRWISIPLNVWHQAVVGNENWIVLSFHTCDVSELIEERPDEENENRFHRRKYADKSLK